VREIDAVNQRGMDVDETRSHKDRWMIIEQGNLWADVLKRWLKRDQTTAMTARVEPLENAGFADESKSSG